MKEPTNKKIALAGVITITIACTTGIVFLLFFNESRSLNEIEVACISPFTGETYQVEDGFSREYCDAVAKIADQAQQLREQYRIDEYNTKLNALRTEYNLTEYFVEWNDLKSKYNLDEYSVHLNAIYLSGDVDDTLDDLRAKVATLGDKYNIKEHRSKLDALSVKYNFHYDFTEEGYYADERNLRTEHNIDAFTEAIIDLLLEAYTE